MDVKKELRSIVNHHLKSQNEAWDELLSNRAPNDMDQHVISEPLLREAFEHKMPLDVVAVALDVRDSTMLMKGAINLENYVDRISDFFTNASREVRKHRGFVGTFTGDGMLAYWIVEMMKLEEVADQALIFSRWALRSFRPLVCDDIQQDTLYYLPAPSGAAQPPPDEEIDSGLAIGMDCGKAIVTPVMTEPTVLGIPIVRAFRAVGEACRDEVAVALGTELAKAIRRSGVPEDARPLEICPRPRPAKKEKSRGSGLNSLLIIRAQ